MLLERRAKKTILLSNLWFLIVAIVPTVNGCEKDFVTFNGVDCLLIVNSRVSYSSAESFCKEYKNASIGTFRTEKMEFMQILAFNVHGIKNSVWINKQLNGSEAQPSMCPLLMEGQDVLQSKNCEERHSFICSYLKEQTKDTSIEKFEEIQKEIFDHKSQVDNLIKQMNESLHSSVNLTLQSFAEIDFEKSAERVVINSSVLNNFFQIAQTIEKCAVPPKISIQEKPSQQYKEGEEISVKCAASGNPTPIISWMGPSGQIISNTSELRILSATRYDTGVYSCVADNSVGPPKLEHVTIDIVHKPVVTVETSEIMTAVGLNVTMKCYVLSNPKPTITWIKDWYPRNDLSDKYYLQTDKSLNETYTESSLTVEITKSDKLQYFDCKASNRLDSAKAEIIVRLSPPFNGTITRIEQIDMNTTEIETQFTSLSLIKEYRLLYKEKGKGRFRKEFLDPTVDKVPETNEYKETFKLDFLNKNTEYKIKISAKNENTDFGNETEEYSIHTTYICGKDAVSVNEWRYMVSHYAYGMNGFDGEYKCSSKIISSEDKDIEVVFNNYGVNGVKRLKVDDAKTSTEKVISSTSDTFNGRVIRINLTPAAGVQKSSGFVLKFRNVREIKNTTVA